MAQENGVKIENVCRTCLSKELELLSVFEIYVGNVTLENVINAVTGVKIEEGDGLPTTVCCICKEKATRAYDFKTQTQEADITLRGLVKTEKSQHAKTVPAIEVGTVDVKTEFSSENNEDYLDLDFSAALTNGDESYGDEESIKIECHGKSTYIKIEEIGKTEDSKKAELVDYKDDTLHCPLCGTSYKEAECLTKHMWEKHARLMAPKKRGRPKKVANTMLTKLNEKGMIENKQGVKQTCILCKDVFKTKEDYKRHMAIHKDIKVINCLLCKKIYLTEKDFQNHKCPQNKNNIEKLKNGEAPDSESGKDLSMSSEVLLQEIAMPNGGALCLSSVYLCEVCGRVFVSLEELHVHRDDEHPELSVRCHLCEKVFASVRSAERHRSVCKGTERKFSCNTCGARFGFEISLNKHILRSHVGQSVSVRFIDRQKAQFRCDICNKGFFSKELLSKHERSHKNVEILYECDMCKKKFNRLSNLRAHILQVHEKGSTQKRSNSCLCLYCGRSFTNSSNLIVHMRRHTGEKPYKCDFCEKGFPRSSDLQCHRRSHTGERPYICRVCGKGFSRSNKLSRHMRVHTGVKPYKCTYCEKAFSQSNDLNLHVRRHTGDKPYVCEICGDRFIQGTALHNHRRAHGHYPPPQPVAYGQPPSTHLHLASLN